MMRLRSLVLVVLLTSATTDLALAQVIPFAGQLQVNDGPTINFTDTTISCTGLPPGDAVVLVGYVIDRHGFQTTNAPTISRTPTFSRQADDNGAFSVDIAGGVKAMSIWLLIDETAASYTIAEPQGSVLRQLPAEGISLEQDLSTSSAKVAINRSHTHVLSISMPGGSMIGGESRPRGSSAMDVTGPIFTVFDAKDGSSADDDGTIDGTVHLTVPSFFDTSLSTAFLFIVDDRTLDFTVLSILHNTIQCRPGYCS
jgi:hypothetical protein